MVPFLDDDLFGAIREFHLRKHGNHAVLLSQYESQDITVKVNGGLTNYHIYATKPISEHRLHTFFRHLEQEILNSGHFNKEDVLSALNKVCTNGGEDVHVFDIVRGYNYYGAKLRIFKCSTDAVDGTMRHVILTGTERPNFVNDIMNASIMNPEKSDITSDFKRICDSYDRSNIYSVILPEHVLELYGEPTEIGNWKFNVIYGKIMFPTSNSTAQEIECIITIVK